MAFFIELTEADSNARTWVNLGRVNRFVQSAGGTPSRISKMASGWISGSRWPKF